MQFPGGIKCTLPIVFSTWGQASNVHVLEYLERGPVRCEARFGEEDQSSQGRQYVSTLFCTEFDREDCQADANGLRALR